MDVTIEQLLTLWIAGVRASGPYAQASVEAWQELTPWLGRQAFLAESTLFMGLCHNHPATTPAEPVLYDAAVSLAPEEAAALDDDFVVVRELMPAEYAVTLHRGPYTTLTDAWQQLLWDWLPASGRTPASGARLEIYLNDPKVTPEAKLLTRLYLPLAPL